MPKKSTEDGCINSQFCTKTFDSIYTPDYEEKQKYVQIKVKESTVSSPDEGKAENLYDNDLQTFISLKASKSSFWRGDFDTMYEINQVKFLSREGDQVVDNLANVIVRAIDGRR